jgi:hypothetical protein
MTADSGVARLSLAPVAAEERLAGSTSRALKSTYVLAGLCGLDVQQPHVEFTLLTSRTLDGL